MPDLQTNNWFEAVRKASTAYGHEFLVYSYPSEQPNLGAWNLEDIPFQQLQKSLRYTSTPAVNQGRSDLPIWCVEKKDPLTQADLLDTEEDQMQELIFRIRTTLSIPYRESLANRLVTLFGDAKEEDVDSVGIALDSLRSFYNFLRLNTNLKCPIISLTPDSTIYASWKGEQNRVFSVHFLSNGDVRFVIFKPNDRHQEKQIRISATATTDTLMETVTPNGLMDWIAE